MSAPVDVSSVRFHLAGLVLRVETDDPVFLDEFASVFGGRTSDPEPPPRSRELVARLLTRMPEWPGYGTLHVSGDDLADPAAFLLGFSSPTIPIRRLPSPGPGRTVLGLGAEAEPTLVFEGDTCRFLTTGRWRRILAHLLFLRLLRLRADALFFHAASLAVGGRGVLLVGPKGSGKSTLALALAARGHGFLGDETACYLPASGELLAFRRPVGIKPGIQAAAVREALAQTRRARDEDGILRTEIDSLWPTATPASASLEAVVFLRGFDGEPALSRIEPGREEVSQLQPLATCLTNGAATHRVFEMVRLLSRVRAYALVAGDPDRTALLVEEVLRESWR